MVPPKLDTLTIRTISNGDTLSAALQAGDIDAAYGMAYEAYPNFENDKYQFSSIQTSRVFFCSMNMTSSILQDEAVRQAVAMGINKQGFVDTLLDGHGVPAAGAFPTGFSTFGSEHVTTEGYDPDGAKALLEAAGWVDSDGDGIREKDGVKLELRWLTYPSRQELPLLAEAAQASLKELGMAVDINCTANRREFLADMGSWDIYASALVTAPSGDPQYFFTTSCLPGMSYNFGAYENEAVTDLISQLSTEFDPARRGRAGHRAPAGHLGRPRLRLLLLPGDEHDLQKQCHRLHRPRLRLLPGYGGSRYHITYKSRPVKL